MENINKGMLVVMKKSSLRIGEIISHPSTLAVISGLVGAVIGFLINLVSGGNATSSIWTALAFAIMLSLSLTAWQVSSQAKSDQQLAGLIQEMVFQTYFLTVLADNEEVSQLAQQRLGQVLTSLSG